jgi:hypothetical protein
VADAVAKSCLRGATWSAGLNGKRNQLKPRSCNTHGTVCEAGHIFPAKGGLPVRTCKATLSRQRA